MERKRYLVSYLFLAEVEADSEQEAKKKLCELRKDKKISGNYTIVEVKANKNLIGDLYG